MSCEDMGWGWDTEVGSRVRDFPRLHRKFKATVEVHTMTSSQKVPKVLESLVLLYCVAEESLSV